MALFVTAGRFKPSTSLEVVIGRYELCEDMFEDERTGFAFEPHIKRSWFWGSVELWSEGGAVGNGLVVIHGKTARLARRRAVHKSTDRPLAVLLCHSFRSVDGSLPIGSRIFVL